MKGRELRAEQEELSASHSETGTGKGGTRLREEPNPTVERA